MDRSIEASTTIRVAYARARLVLLDDPGHVFSEAPTDAERRARQFRTELTVGLGAGASVHQDVSLQLGAPRSTEAGLVLPLAWHATGRERLLPAFKGDLEVSEIRTGTGLRLHGTYTVPLGAIGRFGDGVVGHRLARRSLDGLIEWLAWRLESEVERRLRDGKPVELREHERSEIYIG